MGGRPAGWYADPMTVGAARYWNGRAWTSDVSWGGKVGRDPTPLEEVRHRAARLRADTIVEYLDDAVERNTVEPGIADHLRGDVERLAARGNGRPLASVVLSVDGPDASTPPARPAPADRSFAPPAVPTPAVTGIPTKVARSEPTPEGRETTDHPEPEPIPIQPGHLAAWWNDAGTAVKSDLALHGIAYLGVLLLFTGVTGLIAFSFGTVAPWVRTVTELVIPTSLLVSGWYLAQRGARVVGSALTLLGGAITPVVVTASLTDGSPVPPDLDGVALPVTQGLAVGAVGVVMALVVRRRPESPMRFLVAPMVWVAVGLIAGAGRDPVPQGYDTVRVAPGQLVSVLVAIAISAVLVTTRRPGASPIGAATRSMVLPAAAVVYLLELIAAGAHEWPWPSTILAAIGLCVVAESSVGHLTDERTAAIEYVAVVVGAGRLAVTLDPAWVVAGTAVTLLALLERTGRRGCRSPVVATAAAVTAVVFALTLEDQVASVVSFSVLVVWGTWRHVRPAPWLPIDDAFGVLPAASAAIVVGAAWELAPPGTTMVAAALVVLALAVAGRIWTALADDMLWRWFVPAAAGATAVSSLGYTWGTVSTATAITAVVSATAIGLSTLPRSIRVWSSSVLMVWAGANLAERFDLTASVQLLVLGSLGSILVVGALAVDRPIAGHAAAIGHVVGVGALLAAPSVDVAAILAGLATLGWLATAVVDDRHGAVHLEAARRALESAATDAAAPGDVAARAVVDHVAPVAALVGAATTAALTVDAVGWLDPDDAWTSTVVAAVAGSAAAIARFVPLHRARPLFLVWASLLVALAALVGGSSSVAEPDDWSLVVTLAITIGVILLARSPRPMAFAWLGWTGLFVETLLVADRFGLDRRRLDLVAAGWGFVVLAAALLSRRASGPPTSIRDVTEDRSALPPVALGASALAVGGLLALSDGTQTEIGWTAAGLAGAVVVIAVLTRLGPLAGLGGILATWAVGALAPWDPMNRPWSWAPWALALLLVARVTQRNDQKPFERWDLPTFVVAHGVGLLALFVSFDVGGVDSTFTAFAALSFLVAAVLRRWEWIAAGSALLAVGAASNGPGWFAAVLAVEGVAATGIGLRQFHWMTIWMRWTLITVGAAQLTAAWFELTLWLRWETQTIWLVTVPAGAVVSLATALAWRHAALPRPLVVVWTVAGSVVSLATAAGGAADVDRRPGGVVLAASLVVLAVAVGVLATVLGGWLRWVAAAVASTAWIPLAWAVQMSTPTIAWIGTAIGLAGVGALVLASGRRPASRWMWPGGSFAVLTQIGGGAAALSLLPDRGMTVVVLLAVSAELMGLAVASNRHELFVAAPPVACAAWLLFAGDALRGDANWFTMPIGLTMLVMTAEVRWIRRARGLDPSVWEIALVEVIGMGFLVGSALARELAGDLWYGLLVIGIAVVIAAWGTMTKVLWRGAFGVVMVVAGAVILFGTPILRSITWTGPALWTTVAAVGVAAIVIASVLERGRDRLIAMTRQLSEMTDDWERLSIVGRPHHRDRTGHPNGGMPPPIDHGSA